MKRHTQHRLYHLLPVVFWLLAIGGSVLPLFPFFPLRYLFWAFIPAGVALLCVWIIGRIKRHTNSIEECLQVALLLGVAAYWLPTVVLLIIPIWLYLIYHNLFSFRAFLATLIGFAIVAIWMGVLSQLSTFNFPLQIGHNLSFWLPTGLLLTAYLGSTIARRILRVR